MFPISKRAQATILAAVVLGLTLSVIPAQAAGPRAFQTQDTTTWSIFSWSFWEDAFQPVLTWFQADDQQTTVQQADGPTRVFDAILAQADPNGLAANSTSFAPTTSTETGVN